MPPRIGSFICQIIWCLGLLFESLWYSVTSESTSLCRFSRIFFLLTEGTNWHRLPIFCNEFQIFRIRSRPKFTTECDRAWGLACCYTIHCNTLSGPLTELPRAHGISLIAAIGCDARGYSCSILQADLVPDKSCAWRKPITFEHPFLSSILWNRRTDNYRHRNCGVFGTFVFRCQIATKTRRQTCNWRRRSKSNLELQ